MIGNIFSIGHSNHKIEDLMILLTSNKIEFVVDVRSAPYSKLYPHFNRSSFESYLKNSKIKYLYLGDSIGGRSPMRDDYSNGRVIYKRLAEKEEFKSAIRQIVQISGQHRIVLMCSEKEPLECHRTLLISQEFQKIGIIVLHIHSNGRIESQDQVMQRLLKIWHLEAPDLFGTDKERIEEALLKQEMKIAYFDESMVDSWEDRQ